MLTVRIKAWNYKPYTTAREIPDNSQIFDKTLETLEDLDLVLSLYEEFSHVLRGIDATNGPLIPGYSYQFTFMEDGTPVQIYEGASYAGLWKAYDPASKRRQTMIVPEKILRKLHNWIELPWELPLGHC